MRFEVVQKRYMMMLRRSCFFLIQQPRGAKIATKGVHANEHIFFRALFKEETLWVFEFEHIDSHTLDT